MQGKFYPSVFSNAQITLIVPQPDEQIYIHDKYMGELVKGVILPETRRRLLAIVDRLKELIKVKGYQVAPAELEALLLKHPNIADAAVIPVIDAECGEVPKAIVVSRGPLTAEEVMVFVESHVAHYKRVRHVAFADTIPKSPSGKILRRVLVAAERQR